MKTLLAVLLLSGISFAQSISNPGGASTNPTSGVEPVKSGSVFIDSPESVSGGNVSNSGSYTATAYNLSTALAWCSQLLEAAANGNTFIKICSPSLLTVSETFTFPDGLPANYAPLIVSSVGAITFPDVSTSGKVLTSNGAGSPPTFQTAAGGTTILDHQATTGSLVGNTTDKTVWTYSLPSGTLAAGQGVSISFCTHATAADGPAYKLWFGATSVNYSNTTATSQLCQQWMILNNAGSTTAQSLQSFFTLSNGSVQQTQLVAAAENTNSGSSIVIKVTFNVAATTSVIGDFELIQAVK